MVVYRTRAARYTKSHSSELVYANTYTQFLLTELVCANTLYIYKERESSSTELTVFGL